MKYYLYYISVNYSDTKNGINDNSSFFLYLELESPQKAVADKTSLNLQMEDIEKLRISSSHDSEAIKYQRDAPAQLSYVVPERKLYVSFTINGPSKPFYYFRSKVNTDNR